MGAVKDISSSEFAPEVLDAQVPVVVDFWAPWCGPCRVVGPEIEKLQDRLGDTVKFVKVNVDENREIAMEYGIMSIPSILKFERGAVSKQVVGAMSADVLVGELALEG